MAGVITPECQHEDSKTLNTSRVFESKRWSSRYSSVTIEIEQARQPSAIVLISINNAETDIKVNL